MKKILTGQIQPTVIFHESPDEGGGDGGGGAATQTEEIPKVGSAFSQMIKTMRPDETPAAPDATKPEGDDAAKKAAEDKAKEEAAAKAKETKAKKERKPDPLLETLSPSPATEKKEEKAPELDEKQKAEIEAATKGMSQKAADHFKTVVSQKDAAERRAITAEAELKKIKEAGPQIPAEVKAQLEELDATKKELATLRDTMEKIGAERSPTYQSKFVAGKQKLIDKAKGLVAKLGGDPNAFVAALNLSGKERSEALEEAMANVSAMDAQRVALVITEMEALDEEGASYLSNARESLINEEKHAQQIEAARMKEVAVAREAQFTQVANTMLHRLPDDHPLAAEANAIVDKALVDAKKFLFDTNDFDEFAKASVAHAMFPVLQKRLLESAQRIADLEAELEEIRAAEPGISSGGGAPAKETDQPSSLATRYNREMSGAGAR